MECIYKCTVRNTKNNKQLETKYMAGINFNATQVAPNVGFAPVEKGKYVVIMVNSEFKPTSNGSGKILSISTIVQGGHNHGRSIMFNLNWENASAKAVEIGHGQFSAICHAVNVLHVQDTQQLHNLPFCLEVEVTPDGKYNEVLGISPVSQGQAPVQQMAQPQYQAPVQQTQQVYQHPVQQMAQPQYVAPQGQANPMAQYEQMAQPQQQAPVQQVYQAPVQQVQADVPDWIKNQQAAQAAQPMGNG